MERGGWAGFDSPAPTSQFNLRVEKPRSIALEEAVFSPWQAGTVATVEASQQSRQPLVTNILSTLGSLASNNLGPEKQGCFGTQSLCCLPDAKLLGRN